jgi:hypothetical protein
LAILNTIDSSSLTPESRKALSRLGKLEWISDFYLAGSAALAIYLRHRSVRDLDFMSQVSRLRAIERRDLLQDLIEWDPATRVETARDGFLYVRVDNQVALRFFYYPYPLVESENRLEYAAVASPEDLGLMKLGAIISRGTRRDFVDLYLLCQQIPLSELLARSHDKFGHVNDFALQAIKGLADLSLTQGEPMPELSQPVDWQVVQEWIGDEVRSLAKDRIGWG